MPGFDRTGPSGRGSRTGRGLGDCPPGKENSKDRDHVLFPKDNPLKAIPDITPVNQDDKDEG